MNKELKGLRCVISGSGKIAMHVLEKLLPCGAIPVTVSDSQGYLLDEDGFDYMKYSLLRDIKAQQKSLKWVHAFPLCIVHICWSFEIFLHLIKQGVLEIISTCQVYR